MDDRNKITKNTTFMDTSKRDENAAARIIEQVYVCLRERGYNPINHIVGYIMSGDPTYITNFGGARALITEVARDELMDEFVRFYLEHLKIENGR